MHYIMALKLQFCTVADMQKVRNLDNCKMFTDCTVHSLNYSKTVKSAYKELLGTIKKLFHITGVSYKHLEN